MKPTIFFQFEPWQLANLNMDSLLEAFDASTIAVPSLSGFCGVVEVRFSHTDGVAHPILNMDFARTDEANSLRALRLFQKLGLQLIVVNPFDAKGRIVEDFVDSFHLAVNPEGNNSKLRRASRAEYDAAVDASDTSGRSANTVGTAAIPSNVES